MSSRNEGLNYRAFLSHNGADKPLVEMLAEELEKRGISCWLDKWSLVPGDPWQPAIEEALGHCGTCVVLFGPHGVGPWHNEEMRLALQHRANSREPKLRVLPVILPGGQRDKESDLPGFLQGTTWVSFRQSIYDEDALHRLECGIRGVAPGPGLRPGIPIGECPYLGLKTFQPEDAPLFFGRTAKIQELVDRLRNNFGTPGEVRFLAIIGASGSGKSSLALAGLIPAIRQGNLPGSVRWPLVRCRPGAQPWENLQIALANNKQIAPHMVALPALMARPEDEQRQLHLIANLALHDQPEAHRLLVLIDQFEEIFTVCVDGTARDQLIDNLLYATSVAGGRTIVVLTMRSDFYGQCANYPGLRAAIGDQQSLIGPLSELELRDAIQSPAQLAGCELEPALTELLLADMKGQAGALPFLEHALFKLWERRDGRRLTAKAYMDAGRLEGALDAHAEEFFKKDLSTEERDLCRQLLVDLVHPGEGAADTKKRVLFDDLAFTDAARTVLKKLADARLVATDRDVQPEAAQVELAHEALISGWHRLGEWVDQNREQSRLKERLLDAAREWQKNGKTRDFLYQGAQLAAAEESFGSSGESPSKLGREFLETSIATRDRERRERQREQRNHQRALAAALAVFVLLAVAASAAAIFGFLQKGEAENQTKRTSEIASQANVSLARYSKQTGNDAQALGHLAQALRWNQRNYEAVALTGVMLTQNDWPLQVGGSIRLQRAVDHMQFSPDGRWVVSASYDGAARLWDAATGKAIGEPMMHGGMVNSVQFSPDGRRVVTASYDGTARLWDAITGRAVGEPMKHRGMVNTAQFSPDGRRVVTASYDGMARLWDAATGKALGEPLMHGGMVNAAQFSPDGRQVLSTSYDGTARLWDAITGKAIGESMRHDGAIRSAQFSPDGRRVVTASEDSTARLWDAASANAIGEPMRHEGSVASAQFSPDGQLVVTASYDGTARLWDAASAKAIGEPMKHERAVRSAQFSPDGQAVLTTAEDNTARLWDLVTGKAIGEPINRVNSAQFSPDGQRVLTTGEDKTVRLSDFETGKAIGEPMRHDAVVRSAQFSQDGQRVLTASGDRTLWLWDTAAHQAIDEPMKHEGAVRSAQFSPDGRQVVTASEDSTAQLWDAATLRAIGEPMRHDAVVNSAQFSPDGRWVVTASEDQTARLWDAATGNALGEPMKHGGVVSSAQFSPDGKRVVTASYDWMVRLWDATTGKLIGQPMKHDGLVDSAQFSPDGRRVVSTSYDGTARMWDAATGKAIGEPMRHGGVVNSARFSPDGRWVVTASGDQTARLWDAATGKAIGEPMRHGGVVNSARFSPDGRLVLTASGDQSARLWDAATGKAIGEPMRHDAAVRSARFSPDGQRVVTASEDKTARLWNVATCKAIGDPQRQEGVVNSVQFSPDGQRVLTASGDRTARLWDVVTLSSKDSTEDVLLLADLAESSGGVTMQSSGQAEIMNLIPADQLQAVREKIAARYQQPSSESTPLQRFLKWSVSARTSRSVSPFSKLTVGAWVENRMKEGLLLGLREAIEVDPANAALAASFGQRLADYALRRDSDAAETRRSRGEADFQTRRALKLASDNDDFRRLRVDIVRSLKLESE